MDSYVILIFFFFQTTLPDFAKPEFSVVRLHEEFIWLHDRIEENEKYEGFIVSGLIVLIDSCISTSLKCEHMPKN